MPFTSIVSAMMCILALVYCKRLLFVLCAMVSSCLSYGRGSRDSAGIKDALIIECLGHGLSLVSANHEHAIKQLSKVSFLTLRYGIGIMPGFTNAYKARIHGIWSVPLVLSVTVGKKKHFFTGGVGYTGSFGRKWVDSGSTIPYVFRGYESAIIVSAGYRLCLFRDGVIYGVYPTLAWRDIPARWFEWGFGVYVGVRLNKRKSNFSTNSSYNNKGF